MKVISNPTEAEIKNFMKNKRTFNLPAGEKKPFDDDVADALLETYEFLTEYKPEGKYTCKFGDYGNDVKVAVIAHEKTHAGEPPVEEGKEFTTPQEILDQENRERIELARDPLTESGEYTDKDGIGWYGEGLTEDNDIRATYARRPGAF